MELAAKTAIYVRSTDNVFRRRDATKHGETVLNELIECRLHVTDPGPASVKHKSSAHSIPPRPHPTAPAPRKPVIPLNPIAPYGHGCGAEYGTATTASPVHSRYSLDLDNAEVWTAQSRMTASPLIQKEPVRATEPGFVVRGPVAARRGVSVRGPVQGHRRHCGARTCQRAAQARIHSARQLCAGLCELDRGPWCRFHARVRRTLRAWILPYLLGAATVLVVQKMQPLLVYYGMIVVHLLKLVLAWVLIGAVCLYFGLMTLPAGTDFAGKYKVLLGLLPVLFSPQNALKTANLNPQVDTSNDRLRLHSGAEMSLERTPPLPSKEERHLSDLASSVVNVVPFLAARRESVPRSVDTTPNAECKVYKGHGDFISQKLLQIKHGKRAQSVGPDQPSNSRRHLSPSLLEKEPPARKPPLVHLLGLKLELPFACELKLRLNAGSEAAHPADNESGAGLKRTDTTASHKSVLDTRCNYSKFLSNFSE